MQFQTLDCYSQLILNSRAKNMLRKTASLAMLLEKLDLHLKKTETRCLSLFHLLQKSTQNLSKTLMSNPNFEFRGKYRETL